MREQEDRALLTDTCILRESFFTIGASPYTEKAGPWE